MAMTLGTCGLGGRHNNLHPANTRQRFDFRLNRATQAFGGGNARRLYLQHNGHHAIFHMNPAKHAGRDLQTVKGGADIVFGHFIPPKKGHGD